MIIKIKLINPIIFAGSGLPWQVFGPGNEGVFPGPNHLGDEKKINLWNVSPIKRNPACGILRLRRVDWRHHSSPPQCDPCGAFFYFIVALSYEIKNSPESTGLMFHLF